MNMVQYLEEHGSNLTEEGARNIFKMIADGVVNLHSQNLVHFDLKLDNILVNIDQDGKVIDLCISDLGLAKSQGKFQTNIDFDGTLLYMAPEMFQ